MKHTSRVLAAVVAATALTFTGVHTADAKPADAGSHAKAEKQARAKSDKGAAAKDPATKLGRHVDRVLAQLDRAVSDNRLAKLDTEDRDAVLANAEADRLAIAAVLTPAELRTFRVENYRLVVNILRQAVKAEAAASEAGDAEASALVASAVEKALLVTAASSKSDVKAARADLSGALALLEPEAGEVEAPTGEDLPMLSDPVTDLPWTSAT